MDRIFLFLNEGVDEQQKNKADHTLSDIVIIVFFAHLSKYDTRKEMSCFSRKNEYILKKVGRRHKRHVIISAAVK